MERGFLFQKDNLRNFTKNVIYKIQVFNMYDRDYSGKLNRIELFNAVCEVFRLMGLNAYPT